MLTISASAGSVIAGNAWEHRTTQQASQVFANQAADLNSNVSALIQRYADLTTSAGITIGADSKISATGFAGTIQPQGLPSRYPGWYGFQFLQKVPAAQLASFSAEITAQATPGPVLVQPVVIKPAGPRPVYCLVKFIVAQMPGSGGIIPLSGAQIAPGLDMCATPLAAQIHHVAETGRGAMLAMSPETMSLAQIKLAPGFVMPPDTMANLSSTLGLFIPVYQGGLLPATATAAERSAKLIGWVDSLYDAREIFSTALEGRSGLTLTLRSRTGTTLTDLLIYGSGSKAMHITAPLRGFPDLEVTVSGASPLRGLSPAEQGHVIMAAGVLLSLIIGICCRLLLGSRRRALTLVDVRTGELRHQALHDSLTALPNRTLILDRAEQLLLRGRRDGIDVAAMFLDLDNFKDINDSLGHAAGDQLLQAVAKRLTTALRSSDTVGRLGGDEFVVLAAGAALSGGPELIAQRMLDVLAEPFELGRGRNSTFQVSASIGIAVGDRAKASDLLRDADIALYSAKEAGRACYVLFSPEMQAAVQERIDLETDLRTALHDGQLHLMYQPTFGLVDEAVGGVEALLRWNHPQRGLIPPPEFIPLAESTGTIIEIGRWVLEEACRQAATWHANGHRLSMSVNVSGRQLEQDSFIDEVRSALLESGLAAKWLVLEITESCLMRDAEAVTRRLTALKTIGVRVAVDDFGTGYSSLAYLKQFPIDILKIDKSFVDEVAQSSDGAALVHTLVQLGKALGLQTIAEGIEDIDQLNQLREEKCDTGQGYWYARPMDPAAVTRLLEESGTRYEKSLVPGPRQSTEVAQPAR